MLFRKRYPDRIVKRYVPARRPHRPAPVPHFDVVAPPARHDEMDPDRRRIDAGIKIELAYIVGRQIFQPNRLPDARRARIETAERTFLIGLLAARRIVQCIVTDAYK